MRKLIMVLLAMVLIFSNTKAILSETNSVWEEISRGYFDINAVLIDADNPDVIYIGSNNAVIKSEDGAQIWRDVLSIKGQNRVVNFLASDSQDKNSLYAACGNGLFYSNSGGKYWRHIFGGKSYLENDCTVIAALPAALYLGTRAGLFISKDRGNTWYRSIGKVGKSQILAIALDKNTLDTLYVASREGVFKSRDKGESWVRIFTADSSGNNHDAEEMPQEQTETQGHGIRYLCLDPQNPDYLYLATSRGIYKSKDSGKTWESFTGYGLLSRDIKFILISDSSVLYALTKSAIYEYQDKRWQEISIDLPSTDIRFIALDRNYNLYAACDKGLFKAASSGNNSGRNDLLSLYLKGEPDINRVQEAAVEYAEVHPDKIKAWRKQAARKAILPQLRLGLDRNVTDLWHWEGGSTTKTDDDILKKGRDSVEWDISLSWDFSELIWNNDQTSIDSRSKLMSELRDNILDEVTRIYFERIRLKMEVDSLNIVDRKKRLEKELRLKELAASLDALTGGYFSKAMQ